VPAISEITVINTVIASAALLIALWSTWTAHRAYKLAQSQSEPGVSVDLTPITGQPDWFQVAITVTNRAPYGLRAETLAIAWPPSARLVTWFDGTAPNQLNNPVSRNPMPADKAVRRISLEMRLAATASNSTKSFLFARPSRW
jgi:hypothetical protein